MKKTFVILLTLLASCSGGGDKQAELQKLKREESLLREKIERIEAELAAGDTTAVRTKTVSVTGVRPGLFSHYIEVQAKVEGDEDVTVSAQAMGMVTALDVKAGDKVRPGQVMAAVDDRTIRQNLNAMRAQLELARTVYRKQKNLWDQQIGSEIQYLDAKTKKESLERQVSALQSQLDLTRIKSPISGTVDKVFIKAGQTVSPGVPAVRVVNLENLKVTGEVAEAYIAKVEKGNGVRLFFPDENKEIDAEVSYAGKAINPLNRTFNVEVRLDPGQGTFYPNQVVVLKIADYSSDQAIVLPVGSVMKSDDGEFVFVVAAENGRNIARKHPVRSGRVYNGRTEIVEGLAVNDKVVTFGYQNLVDGDYISF